MARIAVPDRTASNPPVRGGVPSAMWCPHRLNLKRTLHLASLRERPRTRALDEVSRLVVSVILAEIRKGRWEARPLAA